MFKLSSNDEEFNWYLNSPGRWNESSQAEALERVYFSLWPPSLMTSWKNYGLLLLLLVFCHPPNESHFCPKLFYFDIHSHFIVDRKSHHLEWQFRKADNSKRQTFLQMDPKSFCWSRAEVKSRKLKKYLDDVYCLDGSLSARCFVLRSTKVKNAFEEEV